MVKKKQFCISLVKNVILLLLSKMIFSIFWINQMRYILKSEFRVLTSKQNWYFECFFIIKCHFLKLETTSLRIQDENDLFMSYETNWRHLFFELFLTYSSKDILSTKNFYLHSAGKFESSIFYPTFNPLKKYIKMYNKLF